MLLCAPAGGDLLFDESLPEQGRNFTTKIWNAFRLVSNWKVADLEQPLHSKLALEWFEQYLNKCKETLNTQFEQYRISEALMTVYTGFRDEFSSWLLKSSNQDSNNRLTEPLMIKPFTSSRKCYECFTRSCRSSRKRSGRT